MNQEPQPPIRVAYFAEIFPSQSETWIHHEIRELQRRGCVVRVFATHPRPGNIPNELEPFTAITTYMRESSLSMLPAVGRVLRSRLVAPVVRGLLFDAKTLRLKAQVIRDLVYTGYLYPEIQAFQPDIVLAHFSGTRTNLALFYSLLSGVPFLFKMHAADVFRRVALLRLKVASAARVLTISEYNVRYIKEHYSDVNAGRLERHACGVPVEAYSFSDFPQASDIPTIVGVGRLVRMKGFDVLLRATRLLGDSGWRCRVLIVGDGPERHALESLRDQLGIRDVVKFCGYAGPEAVRSMVSAATVFALPAVWDSVQGTQDGIPVALMEAMALGVPVVTTTTSGIPELVEDGVSGFLAAPNDDAAFAASIMRCCALDAESRRELVGRARHKIEQDYSASKLADALVSMLRESVTNVARTAGSSRSA